MVTSYYDSVGLLAICDAIETIEGLQFKPTQAPASGPSLESPRLQIHLPAPYPGLSGGSSTLAQHHLLNHIPPHATVSSIKAMPYSQSQQAAFNQYKVQTGGSMSFQKSVAPASRPGQVQTPTHAPLPPVQNSYNYPIQAVNSPATLNSPAPASSATTAPSTQRTITSNQWNTQHSSPKDGSKSEECHVCGRIFKGPKASTHKQQHIRRLHPTEYTPKRGGKRRVA